MIRRTMATALGGLVAAVLLDRWLGGLSVDDQDRPIRVPVRSRIEIDAPIAEVWARLADIERQPEWMGEMKAVRLLTPGPVGVGTRGEAEVRVLGITVSDPVEVVEFAPPHRFAIRHEGRFKGGGLITLDTLDGGRRTRVEWAETLVPPVLPNLGSLVQGPILGRIFQADLERLKVLVEGERTASGSDAGMPAPGGPAHSVEATRPVAAVVSGGNGHGTATAG
jgi:uncharacterized membrane protein